MRMNSKIRLKAVVFAAAYFLLATPASASSCALLLENLGRSATSIQVVVSKLQRSLPVIDFSQGVHLVKPLDSSAIDSAREKYDQELVTATNSESNESLVDTPKTPEEKMALIESVAATLNKSEPN